MSRPQGWMGNLLLKAPASVRSIRKVPVIGEFVHRISHRILPDTEKVWCRIAAGPAKGLWIELNPRTGQAYLSGDAEKSAQDVLAKRLREGMVFYDLGANIGLFSLLAARLVGPGGKVFSFEPDAQVAGRLRRNIERNGFSNVAVIEAGVWSSTGDQPFITAGTSSPDRGTGNIVTHTNKMESARIRCVTLDEFVRNAPAPDAIKCDVEGAEVEVLRGARNVLALHRPWILCEMHGEAKQTDWQKILAQLQYGFETVDCNHILAFAVESGE